MCIQDIASVLFGQGEGDPVSQSIPFYLFIYFGFSFPPEFLDPSGFVVVPLRLVYPSLPHHNTNYYY